MSRVSQLICIAVNIYDGREPFFWSELNELKRLPVDSVTRGSVCTVLFTLNAYNTTSARAAFNRSVVKKTVSFNIQSVVLLEEPSNIVLSEAVGSHKPDFSSVDRDTSLSIDTATNASSLSSAPVLRKFEGEQRI
jgi:hypothetical protein